MDIYKKSLGVLKKIAGAQSRLAFRIYLIGGWAVWVYNPYMKSKDIDIIIEEKDFWKLKKFLLDLGFRETAKVLEKRGFAVMWDSDKIDIDVYTKRIGKWDIEELLKDSVKKKINSKTIGILSPGTLFMLKAFTALERLGTAKGEKDLSDILALLDATWKDIDFVKVNKHVDLQRVFSLVLKDYKLTTRIYPLSLERYKTIKAHLHKIGLMK